MWRCGIVVGIVAAAVAGCGMDQPVDRVTDVADDDPQMNAAIETARKSVDTFIAVLKSPKPGQIEFSVKMEFIDGEDSEHMWLTPVSFDGKNFQGTVSNDPRDVRTVKLGQKVSVAPDQISDWMYIDNGKLVGGFTSRVLRDKLTPDERAEFDKSLPFVIQ